MNPIRCGEIEEILVMIYENEGFLLEDSLV